MAIWNKKTIGLVKRALKINADYYPEIMGKMIISNAPSIFSGIWGLIKGWVDEKTRKKICIVGNPQKVLSEFLDIDNLPKFLGGKNIEREVSVRAVINAIDDKYTQHMSKC